MSAGSLSKALSAGTSIIGKVGIDQTTQGVSNAVSVTSQPEIFTSGTITVTDSVVAAPGGLGVLLSGASTAGSYVALLATGGNASVVIEVIGLTSGTLWYEGSADSTTGADGNWISLNLKQAGIVNTQITQAITVNGLFRGNTAGIKYIRVRAVGALTGTPLVVLRLSSGVAGEFLFGSIPGGNNVIGGVTATQLPTVLGSQASATSLGVAISTDTASGSITILNSNLSTGAATAGSTVSIIVNGSTGLTVQVTGVWTGTLVLQGSLDNVNWVTLGGTSLTNVGTGFTVATIASATVGIWQADIGGFTQARITASSAVTGTAVLTIRTSLSASLVGIDSSLPTGTNTIGAVNIAAAQTLTTVTTVSAVTSITNALPAGTNLIGKAGIDQTTPGTTNAISLAQVAGTTVVTGGVAGTLGIGGTTAAAAAATGNPVRIGSIARITNPTAVADGQVSNVMTDKLGRLVVVSGHARDLTSWTGTTVAVVTATAIIAAQGVGVFADISALTITNSSATAVQVTISDGTKSFIVQVPAGGGVVQTFSIPLRASSANVAWTSASNVAVTSYYVMANFVLNL